MLAYNSIAILSEHRYNVYQQRKFYQIPERVADER